MAFNGIFDNVTNYNGPKGNLGDYNHASRVFRANNMRLAPKHKFLYHVVLNINPSVRVNTLIDNFTQEDVHILAKSADLPKYRPQVEVLNQYNRKKLLQTRIDYQPVRIEFHDDNAGLTTLLWEAYFRYYYADGDHTRRSTSAAPDTTPDERYRRSAFGSNNAYFDNFTHRYGLDKPGKTEQFFDSIQIFQLHPLNKKSHYTCFTLINPVIEDFSHDDVRSDGNEFSTNSMTVAYETVHYDRGEVLETIAPTSFGIERHYDTTPSPLSLGGSSFGGNKVTSTVLGGISPQKGRTNSVEQWAQNFISTKASEILGNKLNLDRLALQPIINQGLTGRATGSTGIGGINWADIRAAGSEQQSAQQRSDLTDDLPPGAVPWNGKNYNRETERLVNVNGRTYRVPREDVA